MTGHDLGEVVWNGSIERQHTARIRALAIEAASVPKVFPAGLVFDVETIGARLERHIRTVGISGEVYTAVSAAALLGTDSGTASVYLRRARDRGLLVKLDGNTRVKCRAGVVIARFVAVGSA